MYHIKSDKRSQPTPRLLSEGLINCMKHKDFAQITITDIQRASGVGRSTFYRLFDNIADVLAYMCDTQFTESLGRIPTIKHLSNDEFSKAIIAAMMQKEDIITAIAKSGRYDIMFNSAKTCAVNVRKVIVEKYNVDSNSLLSDNQLDYFVATFLCSVITCLSIWISHGRSETVDEVYDCMVYPFRQFEKYANK